MARSTDRVKARADEACVREGEADSNPHARGSASSALSPTCPKCGGTKYRTLASDHSYQRYECSNIDCMETFAVPIAGALASLNARKEEQEAKGMADLKCEKCDRKFVHPKRLTTHAAKCTGGGAPVQRKARKAAPEIRLAAPEEHTTPVRTRDFYIGTALGSSPKQVLLDQLERQQKSLELQLSELRILRKGIAEIEVNPS